MLKLKFYFAAVLMTMNFSFKSADNFAPVAVIELYTSQGCSSCPPADRLLSQTIADANSAGKNIYAMEFHVDYWNSLGWTDPFSDHKFSERQQDYDSYLKTSVYTPQMIVNGKTPFVGSDQSALKSALSSALQENAIVSFKNLAALLQPDKSLKIHYELEGDYNKSLVCFAVVSFQKTTAVSVGENGGKTLMNENIVRQFQSSEALASGDVAFSASAISAEKNTTLIAFVQRSDNLKIIGASKVSIQ